MPTTNIAARMPACNVHPRRAKIRAASRSQLPRSQFAQAHTVGRAVPHFVLCTGDSDFRPLCKRLRKYGKHVTIVTWAVSASKRLGAVCDDMIYIDDLVGAREASTAEMQQCAGTVRAALQAMLSDPHMTIHSTGAVVLPGSAVWVASKRLDSAMSYARFGYPTWHAFLKALQVSHPEVVLHDAADAGGEFGVSLDMTRTSSEVQVATHGLRQLLTVLRDLAAPRKIPAGHLPQASELGGILPMFMQCIGVTLAVQGEEGCGLPRLRTSARSAGMHRVGGREDWGAPPTLEQVGLTDGQAKSMRTALARVSDEVQNALVSIVIMLVGKEAGAGATASMYYAQKTFRARNSLLADASPENVNKAMAAKLKNMLRSSGASDALQHIPELLYTHRSPSHTAAAAAAAEAGNPAVAAAGSGGADDALSTPVDQARLSALKTQRQRRNSLQADSPGRPPVHSGRSVTPAHEGSHSTLQGSSASISSSMQSGSWRDQQDPDRTPRGAAFQQGFHNGSFQGPGPITSAVNSAQSSSRSLMSHFHAPNTAPGGMQSSPPVPAPEPEAAASGSSGDAATDITWKQPNKTEAQKTLSCVARAAYNDALKAWRLPGLTAITPFIPLGVQALCGILLEFTKRGEHLTPPAMRTNLGSVGADFVDDNPSFGPALPASLVGLTVQEAVQLRAAFATAEVNAVNALVTVVTHLMCVNMSGSDVALGKRRMQLREEFAHSDTTVAELSLMLLKEMTDWLRKHGLVDASISDSLKALLVLQRLQGGRGAKAAPPTAEQLSPPVSPAMSFSRRGLADPALAVHHAPSGVEG